VEFRLLGPVEVGHAGRVLEVGPPQRCAVLAALAVEAGRVVSVGTIVDRVWGEEPPEGARRALHAHITRLRRLLEPAGGEGSEPVRVLRRAGGYVLDSTPERVDLLRFQRLVDQARAPGATDEDRVLLLREALGLWRGEPLAGLPGAWAERTRRAWRQRHLDLVVAWAAAELAVDNPRVVIAPLTDLVGEHPFPEPLVAVLMRALSAAGLSADALELYRATRRRLIEELGSEPGTELQRVHQAILRGEVEAGGEPTPAPPTPAVPTALPADVRGFSGRETELARLDGLLSAVDGSSAAVTIAALTGLPGIGKTWLAVRWAHRVRDRFPDGQLYVNLRGFAASGTVLDPADAVRRFLDALGVPAQRMPVDPESRSALYRTLLAGRRVLILLDNARDTAQVRPLLPGAPGCLLLVTSRSELSGLVASDGAYAIGLDLLSSSECRELLARRVGAERLAAEPAATSEIIDSCARLPLALAIVAALGVTRPQLPLRTLAGQLRAAGDRLDVLTTDDPDTDVRAVFSWSYRVLPAAAARLFRLLGLHPGPDLAVAAAASLAALPLTRARALLSELVRAKLADEHRPGRYTSHDLLRAYAADLVLREDSDAQRDAARRRLLDHYVHSAYPATRLVESNRHTIDPSAPAEGVTVVRPEGRSQALTWFSVEHPALAATIADAFRHGHDRRGWELAWCLVDFLDLGGHWDELVIISADALAAGQRLADPVAQAQAHVDLARACLNRGRVPDAEEHLRCSLELSMQARDLPGQARSYLNLGWAAELQGRFAEALDHARRGYEIYVVTGDRVRQGRALGTVGWCYAQVGEYEQALVTCREAIAECERTQDSQGQAHAWDSLGYAYHHLGRYAEAVKCYQQALLLFRRLGYRYNEAIALMYLGDTHRTVGDRHAALDAWRRSAEILGDLDHPDVKKVRDRLTTTE
jgi:DNA-binding SARP family transcriptional activator/tetratricopeptide (TPR) repeat protein